MAVPGLPYSSVGASPPAVSDFPAPYSDICRRTGESVGKRVLGRGVLFSTHPAARARPSVRSGLHCAGNDSGGNSWLST